MDRSCNSVLGGVSLRQLITDVMGDLQQLRYSRRSLHRYQTVWKELVGFAGRENLGSDFSENLATQFIAAYSPTNGERNGTQQEWCRHIDRGVGLLYDYALYGSVNRRPWRARTLWDTSPRSIFKTSRHMKRSELNAWFWVELATRLLTAR